jgi:thiamine monophosphate kinase
MLDDSLKFPEPNLWAGIELSKSGIVGACMDASDGPTGCFYELADKNEVDLIIDVERLKPAIPVSLVAKQLGMDPIALMLTWGNWELIFTANKNEIEKHFDGHPLLDEMIYLGEVVEGEGRVFSGKSKIPLPDLSSKRFSTTSSFSHGFEQYVEVIRSARIITAKFT